MNNKTNQSAKHNEAKEKHIRWQGIALTQLGYSINLILTFSLAVIGFGVSLWSNEWKHHICFCFYSVALISLFLSIIFGLGCTITRLYDFRKTREINKLKRRVVYSPTTSAKIGELRKCTKELGKWTWDLFRFQLGSFFLGFISLAISIAIPIFSDYCRLG